MIKVKENLILIVIIPAIILVVGIILFLRLQYVQNNIQKLSVNVSSSSVDSVKNEMRNQSNEKKEIFVDFTDELFYNGIDTVDQSKKLDIGKIKAGVISHHNLASGLIANFFYQLSKQNINRIIIIGPNHPDVSIVPAISADVVWKTKLGEVRQDQKIIKELQNKGLLQLDYEHIVKEHSIGTLIPFIQHYFSNVEIVPIVLTSKHEKEMSFKLAEALAQYAKEDGTVIIGSIDFSHYLTAEEAYKNDDVTIQAISDYNYKFFENFDSDYIDSPPTIMTVMKTMELIGSKNIFELGHTNSADIMGTEINETTSYFSLLWY